MSKDLKINWQCAHCDKRNIEAFKFQFDVPKLYSVTWECHKCGKETKIELCLTTRAVFKR